MPGNPADGSLKPCHYFMSPDEKSVNSQQTKNDYQYQCPFGGWDCAETTLIGNVQSTCQVPEVLCT